MGSQRRGSGQSRERAGAGMSSGFSVLCSPAGLVTATFGTTTIDVGTALVQAAAQDSRERLLQILADARQTEQHSILSTADGNTVEIHCASDGVQTLVIAGNDPSEVRSRCGELSGDPVAGPLARRIIGTAAPDELTLGLWSELAHLNNELATAQRKLAKSNAELRWLNEQKNQLLGMAAHDLRNPLAAVLGYAAFVLEDEQRLSPDQRGLMRRIVANARLMLAIVEDALDFSAIESGTVRLDLSEFSVAEFLAEAAETNEPIAQRKDIHIVTSTDPGVPAARADRAKLAQVVDNLVTNAVKFSHSGSSVIVTAGAEPGGGIWISVSDRGLGMSPEQKARLFQPFARVGVQPTGGERSTGLGLAIVRRIIEAHRGRVEVESAPGEGTTFTVVLPRQPYKEDNLDRRGHAEPT